MKAARRCVAPSPACTRERVAHGQPLAATPDPGARVRSLVEARACAQGEAGLGDQLRARLLFGRLLIVVTVGGWGAVVAWLHSQPPPEMQSFHQPAPHWHLQQE